MECNCAEKQASGEINTNKKVTDEETTTDREADKNDVNDLPDLEGGSVAGRIHPVRHAARKASDFIDAVMGDDNCDNDNEQ